MQYNRKIYRRGDKIDGKYERRFERLVETCRAELISVTGAENAGSSSATCRLFKYSSIR